MDPFYGEIRIFSFNYPPVYWAQCNGQTVQISQEQVLYTILGTQFGGDGVSTFKLPNLMGSAVCQAGQGVGLTNRTFAKAVGETGVTLNQYQMPTHQHTLKAIPGTVAQLVNTPTANTSYLARTTKQFDYISTGTPDTTLAPQMLSAVGGGGVHENRQPYLAMNFCICTYGEYPIKAS